MMALVNVVMSVLDARGKPEGLGEGLIRNQAVPWQTMVEKCVN